MSDKLMRNFDEDLTIERVNAAIRGDKMIVKIDDIMKLATPLIEKNQISPLAFWLIGTIWRATEQHSSLAEWRDDEIRARDGDPVRIAKLDESIEQLRKHKLLPPQWM